MWKRVLIRLTLNNRPNLNPRSILQIRVHLRIITRYNLHKRLKIQLRFQRALSQKLLRSLQSCVISRTIRLDQRSDNLGVESFCHFNIAIF